MEDTKKSGSRFVAKMLVLLLAATTVACGELGPDDFAAQDSPPGAAGGPSLSDRPLSDPPSPPERLPALPEQDPDQVSGDRAGALEGAATDTAAALVDRVGQPGASALNIEPWKSGQESPGESSRALIPANRPAPAPHELLPPVTEPAPEPESEAAPVCPDAQAARDCRQNSGQWDDTLCECTPIPR